MTKEQATNLLKDRYFLNYCIYPGYWKRLMEKYNDKHKAKKELQRLHKLFDQIREVL